MSTDPTKKKELKITLTVSKGNYTVIGDYLGMDVEKAKQRKKTIMSVPPRHWMMNSV